MLMAVGVTTACEKNAVLDLDSPTRLGGNVKFFNFAVNSPAVNFYVNGTKVTAVSAVGCAILDETNMQECLTSGRESTSGVAYGGAGNGGSGWYSDVPTGAVTISGRIASATPPEDKNLAITNTAATVQPDRFYSYYLSGIYDPTTKQADAFIIEDVLPERDFTVAHVRFVNASSTSVPMALTAVNATTQEEVALGGIVAYKAGGTFAPIPAGTYNLRARAEGSTTDVFTRAGVIFSPGRVYTITARGDVSTNTGMFLDNTANQ